MGVGGSCRPRKHGFLLMGGGGTTVFFPSLAMRNIYVGAESGKKLSVRPC